MDKKLRYGLIGEKLTHSFSKIIHEELCDYTYDLIEIAPEKLDDFMRQRDFAAINVTIPYKEAVIPYLYEIDEQAKKIGAVNTVVNKSGRLYGYNTDFYGLKYMLNRAQINVEGKTVYILGSGGTSKTAYAVCGAMGAAEIYTVSRNKTDKTITYGEAINRGDAEIIINASPVGMYPQNDNIPMGLERFTKLCGVADVIYNPLKTKLLQQAQKLGLPTATGLSMLVAQAHAAAEYFLDRKINDKKIEQILKSLEFSQKNIVLIGMPGCGKSRLARVIAQKLDAELIDIDDKIESECKMAISDIFKEKGEEEFRRIEKEIICGASRMHGKVIATGGGAVKDDENMSRLSQNGVVFFIDRDKDLLSVGGIRPLSYSKEAVYKLYDERLPLYKAAADITILNDGDFTALVEKTLNEIEKLKN